MRPSSSDQIRRDRETFLRPSKVGKWRLCLRALAAHIDGSAEITLLAPPPLGQRLDIVAGKHGAELRDEEATLATVRRVPIDVPEIPNVSFREAQEAVRRSPYDEGRHPLPTCFVSGPARVDGDGLRIIPRHLPPRPDRRLGTLAAPWMPHSNLASEDGAVAHEFIWPHWIVLPALPMPARSIWA